MRQPPPKRQSAKRETLDDIFGPSPAAPKQETLDDIFGKPAAQAARPTPPPITDEVRQPMGPVRAIGTVLSTAFPGAPAGAAAVGAALGREPGESFSEAYQRHMRELGAAERQAKEELYPGMGTALQLGTTGAALARAPLVGARVAKDAPALQKALAAGKRIVGGGLVAGAESAGRQGMEEKALSPLQSAALGAGLTAGIEAAVPTAGALLRGASRIPIVGEGATALVRSVAGPVGEAVTQARRGIADYLAPMGGAASWAARQIEPTDITRIQRQAASTLPGAPTGPTAAMMPGGTDAAAQAVRQAEAAAAQAQQQVKSARLATGQATQARTEALERVKTEEGARLALGRQRQRAFGAQAEETERIGKSRRERLLEVAGAEETEAERILREARQAARAAERGGVQAATEAEQTVIQQAEDQAQSFLQRLRVQKGTTKATQKAIREEKDKVAAANYKTLYDFGSPAEEAQWGLYDEMRDIPGMMAGLRQAAAELRVKGQALGNPPAMIRRIVGSGENAAEETMPELTVELFDKFRQMAREGRVPLPNETGARAQSKMFYKEVVDQFEDALFNQLPEGAREAAQTARKQHRAFFQLLEAAEDGLNLGAAKPGKVSGLLTQNRRELDEVVERVGKMSDQEREVFQTAAREAIDRQIQRSQGEARKVLQKFGSEEMQQKLRLAYGDEMIDELQGLALGQVKQQAKAAGTAARTQAAAKAQRLRAEAEAAVTPLTTRAERARALGERARTQGQERARAQREESLVELEGRRQAAQLRLTQTQQATGAPVRQAREKQRAAEEQAAQLAEQLTQARIARSQAKALPMGDLERALGSSTAQQTFLQRTLPQMTAEQRTQAVQVLGSNVQRRLQDLARQGESPERILREINLLKQNDAVRTLFGPQMDAFAQSLVGRQSMLLPFRTAVVGQAAGRF